MAKYFTECSRVDDGDFRVIFFEIDEETGCRSVTDIVEAPMTSTIEHIMPYDKDDVLVLNPVNGEFERSDFMSLAEEWESAALAEHTVDRNGVKLTLKSIDGTIVLEKQIDLRQAPWNDYSAISLDGKIYSFLEQGYRKVTYQELPVVSID